jgi:hypothetical protein
MFKTGDLVAVHNAPVKTGDFFLPKPKELMGSFGVVVETSHHWGEELSSDSLLNIYFSNLKQTHWIEKCWAKQLCDES